MLGIRNRLLGAGLLGMLALASVVAPKVDAAEPTCQVHNVTQDTRGSSFLLMVAAAIDGDRLRVGGVCPGGAVIDKQLTITGVGGGATLTGRDRVKVLRIRQRGSLTLRNIHISHGRSCAGPSCHSPWGAGITNWGTVVLVHSIVEHNRSSYAGGGIFNQGRMRILASVIRWNRSGGGAGLIAGGWRWANVTVIVDSVLRGNVARESGGAIEFAGTGRMRILGTRITGNRAVHGGGILAWSGVGSSLLAVREAADDVAFSQRVSLLIGQGSRLVGNVATKQGGGIWNDTTLRIVDATVAGNAAGGRGGGVFNRHGTVTLGSGAQVSGNTPDDCHGTTAC